MCQKFQSSLFLVIFPLLGLSTLQNDQFFQNIWMFGSAPGSVQFYLMIYSIAILVRSLWLKKSMKELDYLSNFWYIVYCDFLDFPKKIWGLWAPPPMGPGTPKCLILGSQALQLVAIGGTPRPQIFLGKSRKSKQTLLQKLDGQSNSFMDFFAQVI